MSRRLRHAFVFGTVALVTSRAGAEDPPRSASSSNPWEMHPLALELHLGVATPVGAAGAMVDGSLADWLSIGCGAGTNFIGVEGACGFRLRYVYRPTSGVYLGFGLSTGPHSQSHGSRLGLLFPLAPLGRVHGEREHGFVRYSFAQWENFEFGVEERRASGFHARAYVGLAHMLNPEEGRRHHVSPGDLGLKVMTELLYGGAAVGRAF